MSLLSLANLFLLLTLYPSLATQVNLVILPALSTANFTKIIMQEPNWFIMGNYGSYPTLDYDESSSILDTDCEICSIEAWANGTSELLITPTQRGTGSIYISAFTVLNVSSESVEAETSTYLQNNSMEYCSGCGISSETGCDCFIGYAGDSCGIEIEKLMSKEQEYEIAIGPNEWDFFYMHILDKDDLNFEIYTTNNVIVYLKPDNSTQSMPFMNHSLFTYEVMESGEENTTEYEINCRGYKKRYLLWSVFCMQDQVCNLRIDFGSRNDSHFHELIIILVSSCIGMCLCICTLFVIAKLLKKRIVRRRENLTDPSIVYGCEMNKLFPKHIYQTNNEGQSSCVICFTNINIGDECRELKCAHIFHVECIDQWVQVKQECPICKFSIPFNQKKLFACR